jgi:hypothetical protein
VLKSLSQRLTATVFSGLGVTPEAPTIEQLSPFLSQPLHASQKQIIQNGRFMRGDSLGATPNSIT